MQSHQIPVLDAETRQFLEAFSNMFASMAHLSTAEQRNTIKNMFTFPEDQLEHIEKTENFVVNGRHGPIPVRVYTPASQGTLPVIVFFHRGGWVFGSIDESEAICRRLANTTRSIVVAVDYRLAPEHKFPVPLDDCYDATKWATQKASSLHGNKDKIIVCGESAGGNLAAAVALMARDKGDFSLAGQLLAYPVLTNELNPRFYEESPDKALLSLENMQFFWEAYLNSPDEGDQPYASPLKSDNLKNLPPAFILTADFDALKHEGMEYANQLRNAGAQVEYVSYPQVIHGFLDLPLAEATKEKALQDIAHWITQIK